jgi:hypothetical protein
LNAAPAKIWIVYKRGKRKTSFNLGKVARVHGKKVHEKRGGIYPLILDISTIWRLMVSLKPRSLYTVKRALGTH